MLVEYYCVTHIHAMGKKTLAYPYIRWSGDKIQFKLCGVLAILRLSRDIDFESWWQSVVRDTSILWVKMYDVRICSALVGEMTRTRTPDGLAE